MNAVFDFCFLNFTWRLKRTFYLHATVIFKQSHQVTVLADLVFDIPHQRADARFVAAVGVSWHATLQEVFLLRILFQGHEKLCHFILLLRTQENPESFR